MHTNSTDLINQSLAVFTISTNSRDTHIHSLKRVYAFF